MSDIFPVACDSTKGHAIYDVRDEASNRVVLVCQRCGYAVPLTVALARTPAPTVGVTWPPDFDNGTVTGWRPDA